MKLSQPIPNLQWTCFKIFGKNKLKRKSWKQILDDDNELHFKIFGLKKDTLKRNSWQRNSGDISVFVKSMEVTKNGLAPSTCRKKIPKCSMGLEYPPTPPSLWGGARLESCCQRLWKLETLGSFSGVCSATALLRCATGFGPSLAARVPATSTVFMASKGDGKHRTKELFFYGRQMWKGQSYRPCQLNVDEKCSKPHNKHFCWRTTYPPTPR